MENKEIRYIKAQKIGQKIFDLRKEKGFTREKLAELSNISPNYLYNIEVGSKIPNVVIFLDICNALNVTTGEVLDASIDNNFLAFSEHISSIFNKLSSKEIAFIENSIKFFANYK